MLTLHNNPLRENFGQLTVAQLWECINDLKIDKSTIIPTGKKGNIIRKDLVKRLNPLVNSQFTFKQYLYRISIGSYKIKQTLWVHSPVCLNKYTSLKKVSECKNCEKYELEDNEGHTKEITYNNTNLWGDTFLGWCGPNQPNELDKLRKGIIWLETRELYVKIKEVLYKYVIFDVLKYCIMLYSETLDMNILTNIVVN